MWHFRRDDFGGFILPIAARQNPSHLWFAGLNNGYVRAPIMALAYLAFDPATFAAVLRELAGST